MKVYVLETGCYSDKYVVGVFATPEAAMAARPVRPNAQKASWVDKVGWREDASHFDEDGYGGRLPTWSNGCDWSDLACIEEYEVQE